MIFFSLFSAHVKTVKSEIKKFRTKWIRSIRMRYYFFVFGAFHLRNFIAALTLYLKASSSRLIIWSYGQWKTPASTAKPSSSPKLRHLTKKALQALQSY